MGICSFVRLAGSNPHPSGMRLEARGTLPRPKNSPPDCFYPGFARASLSSPFRHKTKIQIPEWVSAPSFAWLAPIHIPPGCVLKPEGLSHGLKTVHRTVFTLASPGPAFRVPFGTKQKADTRMGICFLVRRKGLEPPTY